MKTEYQSTIIIVKEILSAIAEVPDNANDRVKAVTKIVNRLFTHMLDVLPAPQPDDDTADIELRDKELELARSIHRSTPSEYDILNPSDDFLPQLYPMLVVRALIKHHMAPLDAMKIKDFDRFYFRYRTLIFSASDL
jgi:hypothetical protein